MIESNYKATSEVEKAIARILYNRRNSGSGLVHISTIKRHLCGYHAKIYGDAVLEARELAGNLVRRGLVSVDRRNESYADDIVYFKWTASDLDYIVFMGAA